jgi:RND superfamily putative drug exporter
MSRVLHAVARWCFGHRWLVVAVWLLVLVAGAVGAKASGATLDNTFTIPGSQSQQALDQVQRDFPAAAGTSAQLVFRATDGTTLASPANSAAIARTLAAADRAPQVVAVVSPQVSHLVTPDGKTGIATVEYRVPTSGVQPASVTALTNLSAAANSPTLTVSAGGQALSANSSSTETSEITGLIIALVVLMVTLGSLLAAGMPLITAISGVAAAILGLRGLAAVASISNTAVTLAIMIGLAVGIDYALFIITRHRAQLAAGLDAAGSAAMAVGTAGTAVVFAGCTVIIAMAALAVVGIPFLTMMGLAAAGTVLLAVLIAITLLPAIFGLAGARLRPRPGSRAARLAQRTSRAADAYEPGGTRRPAGARNLAAATDTAGDGAHGAAGTADSHGAAGARGAAGPRPTFGARWLAGVVKRPVLALAGSIVVLLALAAPALSLSLALPDNGYAAQGTTQRTAFDTVSADFGPGFNGPLLVLANLGHPASTAAATHDAVAVAAQLKTFPGVAAVAAPQLDAAGDAALIQVVPTTAPSASATANLVTSIRDQAGAIERATGASVAVTGTTAINVDVSAKLSAALVPFAAIVVGLSLLLLMMVFRSFLIPVKAAAGFLLSIAASFGATVAVFQWGWLANLLGVPATGPIVSFLPIIVIAVLFGLAMDYEVFLATRIREDYVHNGDPRRAIVTGGGASARVVVAAAIIMTSIFASFVLPADPIIKPIAFALAIGVACDALLVRMTAVPAVLALAGRKAWYLPKWLDRILPNLDVEGASLREHHRAPEPRVKEPAN